MHHNSEFLNAYCRRCEALNQKRGRRKFSRKNKAQWVTTPLLSTPLLCFYATHYVKPGTRKEDGVEFDIYDLIDIITDFPYRLVATALRGDWHIFSNTKDHGDFGAVD